MEIPAVVEVGQSIMDIAIQHTGSFERLFEIASKNGRSVTEEFTVGSELNYIEAVNKAVVTIFDVAKTKPATAPITTKIFGSQFTTEFK